MTPVVLLVAPAPGRGGPGRRGGDLFDVAFVDALRSLAGSGSAMSLLLPWSADLAPLVGAALLDLAPSFDLEAAASPAPQGIVPYVPPGEEGADRGGGAFWRASHVSLALDARRSLAEALRDHGPTHVVALGTRRRPAAFRRALRGRQLKALVFRSLYARAQAVEALGVGSDAVLELEEALPPMPADPPGERALEAWSDRTTEADLEPFVPFGLLLQGFFDEWLRDPGPASTRDTS